MGTMESQTDKRRSIAHVICTETPEARRARAARLGVPAGEAWRYNDDGSVRLNWSGRPYKHKPYIDRPLKGVPNPQRRNFRPHPNVESQTNHFRTGEAGELGKRDLWFLASTILRRVYPDLTAHLHKPICDFFVQKEPTKDIRMLDPDHNRLLLDARGHFKTTINLCDIMQWMLAFPNITVALFSGTEELTSRMVDEIKQHFLQNGDFREIYPDWVPQKNLNQFGESGSFTLPNRTQIRREPTLSITTLKSTRAGGHYDIEKFDDVVHEKNSATAKLNQETSRQFSLTLPLLNPGGYRDVIGTLYHYDCLYAPIIEKPKGWKVLVNSALRRDPDLPLFRPEAIRFPERFCVDVNNDYSKQNLEQIWRDDPELFASQYMNDPTSLASDQFSMQKLKAHVIDRRDVPGSVNLFMTWDLAYSTKDHSDYSVGVVAGYSHNGTLFVIDICRGRYAPSDVIEEILRQYRRWPVHHVGIEQDQAARMLLPGLEMRQRQMGLHIPIDMIPLKYGGMAPVQQILALGPILEQHKLWFVDSAQNLEECFREFSRYPKYAHDDICRAISLMAFYRNHGYRPELAPDPEPVVIGGAQVYGDGELGAGIVG